MTEYTEKVRRQKRKGAQQYFGHKGSVDDFIAKIEMDSRNLGKIGILADWRRSLFARNMFDLIVDSKTLKRAYDAREGEGAGQDDVKPVDIWRYYSYRKALEACRLYGHKQPRFTDTVFPEASALHLSALLLACEPEQFHAMSVFSLQQGRKARAVDVSRIEPDHFLFMHPAVLKDCLDARQYEEFKLRVYKNVPYKLQFGIQCLDRRKEAMTNLEALEELYHEVTASIRKAILAVSRNATCDRVFKFAPFDLYRASLWSDRECQGRINTTITWKTMHWINSLLTKVGDKPGKGYKPESLRQVEIPKQDGGKRVLSLPTTVDRTVAKAVALVLQPMFEEIFLPASTGCRRERDRFDALATLQVRYPESKGKFILCADIKKAFDNVNHDMLLTTVFRYVRNSRVQELLRRFVQRTGYEHAGIGIPQGCPLSPLLLNILLHDMLDVPLVERLGNSMTYLRYVDDLCFFGFDGEDEGKNLIDEIQDLLRPVGLELHTTPPKTQIINLSMRSLEMDGGEAELNGSGVGYVVDRYLGLGLRGGMNNQLEFFLPTTWRERLRTMLLEAEAIITHKRQSGKTEGHIHMRHAVISWVKAFAPAWMSVQQRECHAEEIIALCKQISTHCEQLSQTLIRQTMEISFAQWQHLVAETT